MRLIILGILGYIIYRLIRGYFRPLVSRYEGPKVKPEIDNVMIKDPFCEAYFPQHQGVRAVIDGVDYHFCSPECRDRFIDQKKRRESKQ